jgi:hypothetical protein
MNTSEKNKIEYVYYDIIFDCIFVQSRRTTHYDMDYGFITIFLGVL